MTVEAHKFHVRLFQREFHDLSSLTCLNRCTKFGINFTGCNSLISMRIDTRCKTEKEFLTDAFAGSLSLDCFYFFFIVCYKIADAVFNGKTDIFVCFIVAVEVCLREVKTCF